MKKFAYALSDLTFKHESIEDDSPIGSQFLRALGYSPKDNVLLYQVLNKSGMEEISPEESIDFEKGDKFLILEGDRSFKFKIDGFSYEWPESNITLKHLHALTGLANKSFFLSKSEEADLMLSEQTVINLSEAGIEDIYTRLPKQTYELNVQGTIIKVDKSQIIVSEALSLAGIQDAENYQIILKIQGEPKQEVTSKSVIDLAKPGIEKLRLIPREVNNGDAVLNSFQILPKDNEYLNQVFGNFRTIIEQNRRWLVVDNFQLPEGYNHQVISIAVEIPIAYPQAEIDMFYTYPRIQLATGAIPSCTEVDQLIEGKPYQRWSRHRTHLSAWNSASDSVVTHFALIEESLLREVQP